jgi:hypothetical protein
MRLCETAVVYECEYCGFQVIVDSRTDPNPPDECEACKAENARHSQLDNSPTLAEVNARRGFPAEAPA